MKITTPNKQGQIVIPIELRKKFNIDEHTYLKIYTHYDHICIEPLDEKSQPNEQTVIDFPKNKKQKDFHFHSKNPQEKNIAKKVDDIIYK